MSSFKTFRTIHRLYKRINRIKTLVQMQSSCLSSSVDIFEVFSSRMKELQCKVESDYANIEFSECEKVRLAAIQLALHFDHLEAMMPTSSSINARFSPTIITVEVQKVENCVQSFDSIRSHVMMFLMYFKVIHLLAKVNYDPLKNLSVAKHWLNTAERMYMELLSNNGEQNFYDCHELFSKSVKLKPSPDGFDTVDRLFNKNMKLLDEIQKKESNEINHLIESYNTQQDTSIWLGKLLSIIPQLLNESEFKIVAYLLLIAQKVAADKNDSKVRSSIATNWMHYFFGVFDQSKEKLLKKFTENEMVMFRKGFSTLKISSRKTNAVGNGSKSTFNCFSSSIPLASDELRLCVNLIESVEKAKDLLSYSMGLVKKLIRDTDSSHDPMDFIVHNYQMSDLLSISTILADIPDECFNFQVQRFQFLLKMIKWLKKFYPLILGALMTTFFNDINEVLLDLYSTNYERIVANLEIGNGDKKNIQDKIQQKLIELHTLNTNIEE